uniref:hypothetical protein n=1 Tax=Herbidospora sakaeratensis TaxID=564415 RepID=UPI000783E830|nr:hypothetical protein [Herbidospora sakaeratensis]
MRLRTFALAAAMTAAVLATSATPANAGGGGCLRHTNDWFQFDACQGDNGLNVYGDVYIKRFTGSNCKVTLRITDNPDPIVLNCRLGHLGPVVSPRMVKGKRYVTSVTVQSSAGRLYGLAPYSNI